MHTVYEIDPKGGYGVKNIYTFDDESLQDWLHRDEPVSETPEEMIIGRLGLLSQLWQKD